MLKIYFAKLRCAKEWGITTKKEELNKHLRKQTKIYKKYLTRKYENQPKIKENVIFSCVAYNLLAICNLCPKEGRFHISRSNKVWF